MRYLTVVGILKKVKKEAPQGKIQETQRHMCRSGRLLVLFHSALQGSPTLMMPLETVLTALTKSRLIPLTLEKLT